MLNIIENTEDIDLLDHINQFIIIIHHIHHIQTKHILWEEFIAMVDIVELVDIIELEDIEDGDSILLIYTFTF